MKKKNILKEVIDDREDICNLYTRSNDAKQEITNLKRAIKNYGEAHVALENEPCHNYGALEEDRERIEDLEGKSGIDRMISEEQGKRIGTLEGKYSRLDMAIVALAKERDERITTLEDGRKEWSDATYTALRGRVEALETCGIQKDCALNSGYNKRLAALEKEVKDQREDYHAHIRQFVEENEAAHKRQERINKVARDCNNAQAVEIVNIGYQIQELQDRFPKVKAKPGRPKTPPNSMRYGYDG